MIISLPKLDPGDQTIQPPPSLVPKPLWSLHYNFFHDVTFFNFFIKTLNSSRLLVLSTGLENHDSGVGIYAPDAEAYTTFADLFDPIIEDYHGGFKKTDKHPAKEWGDVDTFGNLDPTVSLNTALHVKPTQSVLKHWLLLF